MYTLNQASKVLEDSAIIITSSHRLRRLLLRLGRSIVVASSCFYCVIMEHATSAVLRLPEKDVHQTAEAALVANIIKT